MRRILHCDMNAFYASVEMILQPELRGRAMAVVGSQKDRHGIILAKSELAKQAGVKTGEAIWEAQQKCPKLLLVSPHYEAYIYYSKKAREIYRDYSPRVESYGLDEAWLDLSGSEKLFGRAEDVADQLRGRLKSELQLSISVGVSFNKVFAKFGSDYKKPDATTVIDEDNYKKIIWPRPAAELLGVGPATKRKLARLGIFTIGELAMADPLLLQTKFGKPGLRLHRWANGYDNSQVRIWGEQIPVKTIGNGVTCRHDLSTEREVKTVLMKLSREVAHRLYQGKYKARGLQIYIKDRDLLTREHQCPLDYPSAASAYLYRAAFKLFQERYDWAKPVRALGVRAIDLQPYELPIQEHIFADWQSLSKLEKLESCQFRISEKYGRNSLFPARFLEPDIGAENPPLPIQPPGLPIEEAISS